MGFICSDDLFFFVRRVFLIDLTDLVNNSNEMDMFSERLLCPLIGMACCSCVSLIKAGRVSQVVLVIVDETWMPTQGPDRLSPIARQMIL